MPMTQPPKTQDQTTPTAAQDEDAESAVDAAGLDAAGLDAAGLDGDADGPTGDVATDPAGADLDGAGSDGAGAQGAGPEAAGAEGSGAPRRTAAQRLEEEGDVAADYLEELLDITDLDGDIDIDVENGRAAVSIVADQNDAASARELRRLVGSDGQVLEALQELTRLAVQARTGERTRLMLDVAGFRLARRSELEKVALAAVAGVKADSKPVRLDPMSPFERKVVHDVVAEAGLRSESEGEGDGRRVVVLPAAE